MGETRLPGRENVRIPGDTDTLKDSSSKSCLLESKVSTSFLIFSGFKMRHKTAISAYIFKKSRKGPSFNPGGEGVGGEPTPKGPSLITFDRDKILKQNFG